MASFQRKILLIVVGAITMIWGELKAQDYMILTQSWAMPTLLNPAATGDIDYIRIRGGAQMTWFGSKDSPKNYLATADSPFKLAGKRIGAGVMVSSMSYDLFRNLLVGAQGSYKFNLKKGTLSVGLQLGYYHSKFKGSELILDNRDENEGIDGGPTEGGEGGEGEEDDPEFQEPDKYDTDLPTQDVSGGAFDISIGVRYVHPKFYVGLSGLHLTNTTLRLRKDAEESTDSRYVESKLPATMYFEGGGNIGINNSLISLQPSMVLATDFKDFTGVVVMRATYNNRVTFGIDYRYNRAFGALAALNLKNFYIGYSWEYDYSGHPRGSTGNHELVIGYQFKLDMGGKNMFSHRSIRIM
ncbi:MAG: PorP/SprF family type IX secretion system membrane protein [Muribaculaceae bacterium]|nr:PorP/SprF family type IX secretion system membrane protein [Muribaculaceae bacterium]